MIIYHKDIDNVEDIQLTKGFYNLIYQLDELPKVFKQQKLPRTVTFYGKRGVLNEVLLDEQNKTVTVKIWIANNPIPLIYALYLIGGALITWGVSATANNLTKIVKTVFNPFTLLLVGGIALTVYGIPKIKGR